MEIRPSALDPCWVRLGLSLPVLLTVRPEPRLARDPLGSCSRSWLPRVRPMITVPRTNRARLGAGRKSYDPE